MCVYVNTFVCFAQIQMRVLILYRVNPQVLTKTKTKTNNNNKQTKNKNPPIKSAGNNILNVNLLCWAFASLLPKSHKALNPKKFYKYFLNF